MTLPPERLTVKRAANEEPLDLLYFERPQKRRIPAEWSDRGEGVQYHYKLKRVRARGSRPSNSITPPKPGYPTIATTKPGEEVDYIEKLAAKKKAEQERLKKAAAQNTATSASSGLTGEDGTSKDEASSTEQPRRLFFDIKASTPSAKRKRHDSESPLAVFVESKVAKVKADGTRARPQRPDSPETSTPSRKRPNVRATLSTEATLSRNISRQTLNDDFEKAAQKFADEELTKSQQAEELTRKIKVLSITRAKDETNMTDSDAEVDYVYDTYIRCPVGVEATGNEDIDEISKPGVGFLVIGEDDAEFWETFGEDEEFDENAWNSDQDDENAENWYGADYPEDEVDIDDEYDEDAYRFRVNASDNEDYGPEDEGEGWSDSEDEYSYANRKPAGAAHAQGDDDDDDLEHVNAESNT